MKTIVFAFILLFFFVSAEILKRKNVGRTIEPESVALEIIFAGSCREFNDRIIPTMWVSKHAGCLPIQVNVSGNPDNNDLNMHHFCTKLKKHRSIIHFVEIFSEESDHIQYPNYVVHGEVCLTLLWPV